MTHVLRRAALYLRGRLHRRGSAIGLRGRCVICGHETVFLFDDPALYRESLTCRECRTTSRYRSLARGLLWITPGRTCRVSAS